MSISSINPYLSALYAQYQTSRINGTTNQSSDQSAASSAIQATTSVDGDVFQLSIPPLTAGYSAEEAGAYSSQNPPPPPPPKEDDQIKIFLDKVANGTATEDDLTAMQTYLQNLSSGSSQTSGSSTEDPIGSFLSIVASGTATAEDLASMQSILQNMQPASRSGQTDDPIKAFLDKVASGTATTDDLTAMQTFLQNLQQQTATNTHHQRHDNSDTSESGDQIKIFLDKVASGTATADDLTAMQTFLQNLQQSDNA